MYVLKEIKKRDGLIDSYNKNKIVNAIYAAARSVGGDDISIAETIADKVEKEMMAFEADIPTVDDIQNMVERVLIKEGHAKTAKAYILFRDKRDRARDSNSQLMTTIRDLTLEDSSTMDLKRENANIDGNSTMGTMLRYGSEASKRFVHLNLLRPEHSKAHLSGLIHIHDMDFYPLTINCITQDTQLSIIDHCGEKKTITAKFFDSLFVNKGKSAINLSMFNFKILSTGSNFVRINNIMRRPIGEKEIVYRIKVENRDEVLEVTGNHLIPIQRSKYSDILVKAKNIIIGDRLTLYSNTSPYLYKVSSIEAIDDYQGYVYDIETEDNYFIANNYLVHNCIQLDIAKLFKNGFSTGHGKLREPADIRSASSLAAIAIQSDQNDFFGGQSIAKFDYDLAKYVALTYVNEFIRTLDYDDILSEEKRKILKSKCKNYINECGHIMHEEGIHFINNSLLELSEVDASYLNNDALEQRHEKAFKYTNKTTYQAMEAFIHNMNTLHCLPSYERLWVYDRQDNAVMLLSIKELHALFINNKIYTDRYQVFSINSTSQEVELKNIICIQRKDDHREMVTITSESGHKTTVTTNHKIFSLKDGRLAKDLPKNIDNVVVPCHFDIPLYKGLSDYNDERKLDLIELIGYYISSGRIVNDEEIYITIPHSMSDTILPRLEYLFYSTFSLKEKGIYQVPTNSSFFGTFILKIGIESAKTILEFAGACGDKRIPDFILQGSDEEKRIFLSFFVYDDDKHFSATFSNRTIISQINFMLLSLGKRPIIEFNEDRSISISLNGPYPCDKLVQSGVDASIIKEKIKYRNHFNSGNDYVYDIAVEDNENFLSEDGVCVCNSRAGAQVPFSSINYGTDTSIEGRTITANLLYALEAGLGDGETPIFPVHIFKVKDGINGKNGDTNYDLFQLACKVSGERLFPNFTFIDAPFNLKYYKGNPETESAVMGCRTRVVSNINDREREIFTSRGNLSFTTINLPRLAILANKNLNIFFESLDNTISLVFEQLLDRFEVQAKRKVKNLPFAMGQGVYLDSEKYGPNDEIREIIKHGTLTVGFIGLAECLVSLIGKHHGESEEAQELGLKIVGHIRKRCDEQTQKTNLNFSCIGSPAEGLCLAGDTLVHTEKGLKPIKEIRIGDLVYTFNENTLKVELDEVVNAGMTFESHSVVRLTLSDTCSITCTPNHPIGIHLDNTKDKVSYIEAENLFPELNQHIWTLYENQDKDLSICDAGVCIIDKIFLRDEIPVFDISMKKNHNFFVSEMGLLVHNSGRFLQIDKKQFGIIEGVTDRDYYTNSSHVPVYYNTSISHKIDVEAPYHELENGGHIAYVEIDGDLSANPEAVEQIIQYMKKAGIGYGSINHNGADFDPVCKFHGKIGDVCPRCGRHEFEEIDEDELKKRLANHVSDYSVDDEIALKKENFSWMLECID